MNHKERNLKWLNIAKKERSHAECNMKKKKAEGDQHSATVYRVRIAALDLYIKTKMKQCL